MDAAYHMTFYKRAIKNTEREAFGTPYLWLFAVDFNELNKNILSPELQFISLSTASQTLHIRVPLHLFIRISYIVGDQFLHACWALKIDKNTKKKTERKRDRWLHSRTCHTHGIVCAFWQERQLTLFVFETVDLAGRSKIDREGFVKSRKSP